MPFELYCIRCGKMERFPIDMPLTGYICDECEKKHKEEIENELD